MSVIRRLARPTSRLLSAVIVTGAGAMLAGDTGADVVKASYITNTFYNYKLLHMPDLDQRRSTLPADGGMYCVPTSVFNMFAYAANHGYPAAPPEDGDWQLQSKYIEATLWLNVIGNWMNTDPDDGTSGSGTKAGMDALIAQAPYLKRVHKGLSSSYNPTVAKLALYGCQGWAMSFVYGKWAVVGTHNGLPVVDRVGGHAVTLTRAYRDSDQWILRYRDPADDTALTTQSAFKNTTRTPYNYSAYYGGTSIYNIHSLNAIFNTSGGTRVIDTIYGIRPLYGLTFHNTGGAVTGGGGLVQMLDPLAFEGSENTTLPSVTIPSSLAVLDFDFDGDFQNALVIATSSIFPLPPRLRTLDLTTGQLAILTPSPQGLRRFATDRFNHIYAFDGGGVLHFLAEDGTPLASTEAIPDPTEVAVHTGDDSVWIISVPERTVVKLFADFSETLLTQVVPAAVPMAGDARFAIHPLTGEAWFMTDANDTLYGLYMLPSGGVGVRVFNAPELTGAESFSFGDDGELFVSGGGTMKVLAPSANHTWVLDPAHPFQGLSAGSHLTMLRNSDNYDPIEHDGPQWRNLTQAELEENGPFIGDCPADLNADEFIDAADLSVLLANWGPNAHGPADIDDDGDVDSVDLSHLLSAWGPCM